MNEGKFGTQEAVWLTTITISAKVFFGSPATVAAIVGPAGWYMTLISAATALVGFIFIYLLLRRFPDKDLIEVFDLTFGRILGFGASAILAVYLLFVAITRLSEFTQIIRVYVYWLSPNWYIVSFFVPSVFVLSLLSLENIARLAKLLAYPMLAGFILVLILGQQNYHLSNLFPILGHGLGKTLSTGIIRSSVYGEVIILAIFARSFQGIEHIKKQGYWSIALSGLLVSVSLGIFSLTFPYYTAREITAPMYEMAALIDYGQGLQRVEPIFLFIWMISTLISTTAVFYSFIHVYAKMFRIRDSRPLILAGAGILFTGALMHKNIISTIVGSVEDIRKSGSLVFFVLPLAALIVAIIRKKGVRRNA